MAKHSGRSNTSKTKRAAPLQPLTVLVSSPGDVQAEREAVDGVLEDINQTVGEERHFVLRPWRYENRIVSQIGPGPQPAVDDQTPDYDIYLGIMSGRFGTPTGEFGSGTEKEFRDAVEMWSQEGRPWVMFFFQDPAPSPNSAQQAKEVMRVWSFREELQTLGIVATYDARGQSEKTFARILRNQLEKLALRLIAAEDEPAADEPKDDPTRYLRWLLSHTSHINIRGVGAASGDARRFPIEDLYITLRTHAGSHQPDRTAPLETEGLPERGSGLIELRKALSQHRLAVIGDPGAGKTTFLRRVACAWCKVHLNQDQEAKDWLGLESQSDHDSNRLPILVSLAQLSQHVESSLGLSKDMPGTSAAAAWLPHFLAAQARDNHWRLDETFFADKLENGLAVILLDGLDEAANSRSRRNLVKLIDNLEAAYQECPIIATSRPAALNDRVAFSGFEQARIEPLDDGAVETFLTRWCEALYENQLAEARRHCGELLTAMRLRPDIRRMARNPVMLTALAVVHWNKRSLPEQRAELYDLIVKQLAESREDYEGRESADRLLGALSELALAMHNAPEGRQTRTPHHAAAETIAAEWASAATGKSAVETAERFLNAAELDSGIIKREGDELRFWHLTFQEYLAAKAIAARSEPEQQKLLLSGDPKKLYLPEWREVVLLLAGILYQHGRQRRTDPFFKAVLDDLGERGTLAEQARCAGLLGAIVRDLSPSKYVPADARYHQLMEDVLGIFDAKRAAQVEIKTRIEAADALGQAGDPRLDSRGEDYWITIPAKKFVMGAQAEDPKPNYDNEAQSNESPPHEVQLDSFRIARYPVTVEQYEQFVEHDGYADQRWWAAGGFGQFEKPHNWEEQLEFPSRPVTDVSWFEAAAFCAWMGMRLPSEAEWERAARGTEARRYPWGPEDADESRLNYKRNIGCVTPVGIYPAGSTPDGICDLAGNVWEWCSDWFAADYYARSSKKNPTGPEQGEFRVLRGGAWVSGAAYCRAAIRFRGLPEFRDYGVGFRLVDSFQDS